MTITFGTQGFRSVPSSISALRAGLGLWTRHQPLWGLGRCASQLLWLSLDWTQLPEDRSPGAELPFTKPASAAATLPTSSKVTCPGPWQMQSPGLPFWHSKMWAFRIADRFKKLFTSPQVSFLELTACEDPTLAVGTSDGIVADPNTASTSAGLWLKPLGTKGCSQLGICFQQLGCKR